MGTLLIEGAYLVDLDAPFEPADIFISDGRIGEIGPDIQRPADRTIEASGQFVMPGLIDAHKHSHQELFKGLTDNLPLEPWLLIAVHCGRELAPRELYVSACIGALEELKLGTTTVLDNSGFNPSEFATNVEAVMQAYVDTGIRAGVAPIYEDLDVYDSFPFHLLDPVPPIPRLERGRPKASDLEPLLRDFLSRWKDGHERIQVFLSPSGCNRCSREVLGLTADLSKEFEVGIHSHLHETKAEILVMERMFEGRVIPYLREIGFLGPRCSFAHGVWLKDEEIRVLAETGSSIIHSPVSNLKLGSGVAPVQAMRANGLNVALGTDDVSCNDNHNMFEAMKLAGLLHKLYGDPTTWLGGRDALEMCWRGGAKILGWPIGALEEGALADLVILSAPNLYRMPKKHFLDQLVFSELGSSVQTVIVGGEVVVEEGRVLTVDEKRLYQEAAEIVRTTYEDLPSRLKALAPAEAILKQMDEAVRKYPLPFSRFIGGG
ncbi:MAG: amidohydrolase family protein [Nitrospinota bacterium]